LDFYHTTGYLETVAQAAHPRNKESRKTWLDSRCHQLKHDDNAANHMLTEMKTFRQKSLK